MKTIHIKFAATNLKSKAITSFWAGEDDIDNDAEDFEEEWLPQDAW